jgi:hypothetical protein
MEQELISKKDLLGLTGISYGQLYRWKRKNLIPEEWFIRKSTFTGQETFFPKDDILERIDKIKDMKEERSLDDLADIFTPDLIELALDKIEIVKRNIVTSTTLDFYNELEGNSKVYTFEKILYLTILDRAFQSGEISRDEGGTLLGVIKENYPKFEGKNCDLIFLRKLGISFCFLITSPAEILTEKGARVLLRINLGGCIEELKSKLA